MGFLQYSIFNINTRKAVKRGGIKVLPYLFFPLYVYEDCGYTALSPHTLELSLAPYAFSMLHSLTGDNNQDYWE
jgi:hypothetical protein